MGEGLPRVSATTRPPEPLPQRISELESPAPGPHGPASQPQTWRLPDVHGRAGWGRWSEEARLWLWGRPGEESGYVGVQGQWPPQAPARMQADRPWAPSGLTLPDAWWPGLESQYCCMILDRLLNLPHPFPPCRAGRKAPTIGGAWASSDHVGPPRLGQCLQSPAGEQWALLTWPWSGAEDLASSDHRSCPQSGRGSCGQEQPQGPQGRRAGDTMQGGGRQERLGGCRSCAMGAAACVGSGSPGGPEGSSALEQPWPGGGAWKLRGWSCFSPIFLPPPPSLHPVAQQLLLSLCWGRPQLGVLRALSPLRGSATQSTVLCTCCFLGCRHRGSLH
ncbi:uncharacterized protein LOC106009086 isoform X2 [Heterocephalus glaber]|uniref:Uncharacterized protein LOC106009086 isoform X2 n=1 Tax=Heterocephalus glaber TaxID=10181 RepID=A0AAX6SSE5_HETGA|nr:uncharacterized protein LOC106009086 isoform X2 [Heterocephalus glaber]